MWCDRLSNIGGDCMTVKNAVEGSANYIYANCKSVNVVHSEVVRCQFGEDETAKNERDDSHADTSCCGEEPDEKDEGTDAYSKIGRDVYCSKEFILSPMKTIVGIWLAIHPIIVFVHF